MPYRVYAEIRHRHRQRSMMQYANAKESNAPPEKDERGAL
jgi:hypothetical protein